MFSVENVAKIVLYSHHCLIEIIEKFLSLKHQNTEKIENSNCLGIQILEVQ